MTSSKLSKWYEKGLHFSCTGCGKCCTGSPGYVFLTEEDELKIANHLKISLEEFQKKYTCIFMGRRSLIEGKKNYDCIFLKDSKCTLYEARPKQCRTYPFWSSIMESKKNWDEEKLACEGIESKDSKYFSKEQIEELIS